MAASRAPLQNTRPTAGVSSTSSATLDVSGGDTDHRYRAREELGRGGMGVVVAADDEVFGREVALKLLIGAGSPRAQQRFVEEARITGQLEHPGIVPVHDLGFDSQGRPWLAMKRVRGETLQQLMIAARQANHTWADDAHWLDILLKVCDAVGYAHSRGIIHRDLKPANIMTGAFGEVHVMDWGLARLIASDGDGDQRGPSPAPPMTDAPVSVSPSQRRAELTVEGDVLGTPAYMPPEQATGAIDQLDARTDTFALGAMLYGLLTLQAPYSGKSSAAVVAAAATCDSLPPRKRAPGRRIPVELEAICRKAMAPNPAYRYPTAAAFADDIRAYRQSQPITARRASVAGRFLKWARRHPTTAAVMMVGVVLVSVTIGVVAVFLQQVAEQERGRLQAEAEAAAESRAHIEQLARAGQLEDLLRELGGEIRDRKDQLYQEFVSLIMAARASGQDDRSFIDEIGPERVRRYIEAYDRLFEAERAGIVTARGIDYFHRGLLLHVGVRELHAAAADYTRALERSPEISGALANRAAIHFELGDIPAALADLDALLRREPDHAASLRLRGTIRGADGDIEGALADFDRVVQLEPEAPENWHNRGTQHATLGHFREAVHDFDRALTLRPDEPDYLTNRGNALLHLGDPEGALASHNRALEVDPRHVRALVNRGDFHAIRLDEDAAIADYSRALAIDPSFPLALYHRGSSYLRTKRYREADADFTAWLELEPTVEGYYHRGNVRRESNRFAEAEADYTAALALVPAHHNSLNNRGLCRRQLGNTEGAIADFRAAVGISRGYWEAWGNLAFALRQVDPAGARVAIVEAWRHCPPGEMRSTLADYVREFGATLPD